MENFDVCQSTRATFFKDALGVLMGEKALAICGDFVGAAESSDLLKQFEHHPDRRLRLGDAHGHYLGTFHWQKSPEEYIPEARKFAPIVAEFCPTWKQIVNLLQEELSSEGLSLRPAVWRGQRASTPLVRSWISGNEFALIPHEDASQCADPKQYDFEIQNILSAGRVCSLNLCLSGSNGGELLLWEYIPTEADKSQYGTGLEGGPYPESLVKDRNKLKVPIKRGDLYIFNGRYIHAVTAGSGTRATISTLIGIASKRECVMWT
jgi:hypothetical protein